MTRRLYRRICTEVQVLCDLLAIDVRSHTDGGKDAKRLEHDVQAFPARFSSIAKRSISTRAQRLMYERNWRLLMQKGSKGTR
jgi:hypothetical protein